MDYENRPSRGPVIAAIICAIVAVTAAVIIVILSFTGVIGGKDTQTASDRASSRTGSSGSAMQERVRNRTQSDRSEGGQSAARQKAEEDKEAETRYYVMIEQLNGYEITRQAEYETLGIRNELVLYGDGTGYTVESDRYAVVTADVSWDETTITVRDVTYQYTTEGDVLHLTYGNSGSYILFQLQSEPAPERPEDWSDERLTGVKVYFMNMVDHNYNELYLRAAGDASYGEPLNQGFVLDYTAYIFQDTGLVLTNGDPGLYDIRLVDDAGETYDFSQVELFGGAGVLIMGRDDGVEGICLYVTLEEEYTVYLPE